MIKQFYKDYIAVLRIYHWIAVVDVAILGFISSEPSTYALAIGCILWIWIAALEADNSKELLELFRREDD